ncbi:putative HLA-B associated transcript 5 isoform CRA_b protein [Naja naja]|nr:putative HLA-B associated transcript 5 isoform CRA_b protein [Naja naja]
MPKVVAISHYAGTMLLLLAGIACLRGKKLASYNFDFRSWPVDFRWDEFTSRSDSGNVPLLRSEPKHRSAINGFLHAVKKLPCQIARLCLLAAEGSDAHYKGRRAKLAACDGNEIDTIFVDRRDTLHPQGRKLVICCEGNAGFYEVGCISTPLDAGYSVLGWNHPGFAGSTGVPLPQNEANAMDVVMQYAIHRLGFLPEDIILYACAVILDASFDDLVPLALKVMPESWSKGKNKKRTLLYGPMVSPLLNLLTSLLNGSVRSLVTRTVRQHLNLNNAEQLCKYQGPVLLVRRTKDEIITTTYPKIMTEEGLRIVREWLEASTPMEEASMYSRYEVEDEWCLSVLKSYQAEEGDEFPWSVGEDMTLDGRRQLALFLARKHLQNFEATHCTPLPPQEFHLPWSL